MALARLFRSTVFVTLLVLALGVIGHAQPVTVSFWHIYNPGSAAGDLMARAVEDFNVEHAGEITIEATTVGFFEMFDRYPVALAAGVGPDVIIFNLDGVRKEAHQGWLTDLTPLIDRDGVDLSDFLPGAMEAVTYEGQIYALPFNLDTRILYYNRALFSEAGLDPDAPPVRWEDLQHVAAQLTRTDSDGSYTRLGFHPMWGNVWFVPWLHSNSGRWFDEGGNPVIDAPQNIEALQFVTSFIQQYGLDRMGEFGDTFDGASAFQGAQTLGMIIQADDFTRHLENNHPSLDFGVGMIPYNTEPSSQLGGFGIYLPRGEKVEAAWQVAQYFSGIDFMSKWVETTGAIGGRISVARDLHYNDPRRLRAAEQTLFARFNDAQTHPEIDAWGDIFSRVDQAIGLQLTPRAALEEAQRIVESRMAQIR